MRKQDSRRRGKSGSRSDRMVVAVVLQGKVTEKEYFDRLKSEYRLPNLNIKVENCSPEQMGGKAARGLDRDKDAPFSYIFYVVDVDNTSEKQFAAAFREAEKKTSRKATHAFIVSNESFETWLCAHHRKLPVRCIPRADLQNELEKLGLLDRKKLQPDFNLKGHAVASRNVTQWEWNDYNPAISGTAMGKLVEFLIENLSQK